MNNISMIKMVVLDLNGTLLNQHQLISQRNQSAILTCLQQGIKVVIATARPPRSVRRFVPVQLLQHMMVIFYNGALVIDQYGITKSFTLPLSLSENMITYVHTHFPNASCSVESQDVLYTESADLSPWISSNVITANEMKKIRANKLLIYGDIDFSNFNKEYQEKASIVLTDSGKIVQVTKKGTNKAKAVRSLCDEMLIPMSQVMALGDDRNDLELFLQCGYPVAMENAIDELKQHAWKITDTNDKDGVAVVLEEI
ncbi:MAG: hydrolase [Sporolactobacillus laevolacticus]|nr:hydrolase [Sporolactobacillus laevolacticus]